MNAIQPICLWVSGPGGLGKSTVCDLLEDSKLPVFRTDDFIIELEDWCSDVELMRDYFDLVPHRIGCWLETLVQNQLCSNFHDAFFDEQHGITLQQPISCIDGFMPYLLQQKIIERFESMGFRVWIASATAQLQFVADKGVGNEIGNSQTLTRIDKT